MISVSDLDIFIVHKFILIETWLDDTASPERRLLILGLLSTPQAVNDKSSREVAVLLQLSLKRCPVETKSFKGMQLLLAPVEEFYMCTLLPKSKRVLEELTKMSSFWVHVIRSPYSCDRAAKVQCGNPSSMMSFLYIKYRTFQIPDLK